MAIARKPLIALFLASVFASASVAPAAAVVATKAEEPICTDRPAKANAICTVPKGKIQLEISAAGWSLTKAAGTRGETLLIGASVVKLGLSDRSDLEVGISPYSRLTINQGGVRRRTSGFGDAVVRYKHRLTRGGVATQVGVIPFVKLPTAASGLGNGKVEGGIAVPITLSLGGPVSMTLGPELDLLADADGKGRHIAVVNLVNVALPIADRLTLAGELWSNFNFDPSGTAKQASADAALAYLVSDRLQIDICVNAGLTKDTPDVEVFLGFSTRF